MAWTLLHTYITNKQTMSACVYTCDITTTRQEWIITNGLNLTTNIHNKQKNKPTNVCIYLPVTHFPDDALGAAVARAGLSVARVGLSAAVTCWNTAKSYTCSYLARSGCNKSVLSWAIILCCKAILGSGQPKLMRMNFDMTHAPGAGLIARPVDQQSSVLSLSRGCPHQVAGKYHATILNFASFLRVPQNQNIYDPHNFIQFIKAEFTPSIRYSMLLILHY